MKIFQVVCFALALATGLCTPWQSAAAASPEVADSPPASDTALSPANDSDRQGSTAPQELTPITVTGERVANLQPASTYGTVATALRYDPAVDLQSRGLPESQADISVRGGLFENTGFRLGAVTIFDPQTGHYSVELPIDPALLTQPEVITDSEQALGSFNASVATVNYGYRPLDNGGQLTAGLGTDRLRYGTFRASRKADWEGNKTIAGALSVSGSAGDGSVPFGDHDFRRFTGQLQVLAPGSETNALFGFQDKFFGWPGMYTGFASLPETDDTQTGLLVIDHRRQVNLGWWRVSSAYRWLEDDYDFDRRTVDSGGPGSFEHKTHNFALAIDGEIRWAGFEWRLWGQYSADQLDRSTDLTGGDFNSRSYFSAALAPGRQWDLKGGRSLRVRGGTRLDTSNRDDTVLLPLFGVSLEQDTIGGHRWISLDYSQNSQLPGYTALKSRSAGLFGGNPDLGRESASTIALSGGYAGTRLQVSASLFYRRDDDLVDWTFSSPSPNARQANPVDVDVTGFEALVAWQTGAFRLIGSYAWISKDEDYGSAMVDASFYALNFARHRVTLAVVYTPFEGVELRLDNEYRVQQDNVLRSGDDTGYLLAASVQWRPSFSDRLALIAVVDNATADEFQEFPGTPAAGRQFSLGLAFNW